MIIADLCSSSVTAKKRRHSFHQKKLEVLLFYKDSLERRLSALTASIETLKQQINRDMEEIDQT